MYLLFKFFCSLSSWISYSLSHKFKYFFKIFIFKSLSNIFSSSFLQPVAQFYIVLFGSFSEKKFLILMKSNLSFYFIFWINNNGNHYYYFTDSDFDVMSKNSFFNHKSQRQNILFHIFF